MTLTRILLPLLIWIVAAIGASAVVPIAIREWFSYRIVDYYTRRGFIHQRIEACPFHPHGKTAGRH